MRLLRSCAIIVLLVMSMILMSCGGGGGGASESRGGNDDSSGSEDNPKPEPEQVQTLTAEQAWDALYAAYAGIGYNSGSTTGENAALYDIMFDDVSLLASYLALQALDLENNINDFQVMLLSGGSRTYTYQAAGVDVTLTVRFTLTSLATGRFSADLSIDFDAGGFTHDGVTYTGKGTGAELTALLNGTITINLSSMTVSPRLVDVSVATNKDLSAIYPEWSVQYKDWNIAYAIDQDLLNYSIAPAMISVLVAAPAQADNRLYTLSGGFDIIDGTTRSYAFDMTYGQLDLGSGVYVALRGTLSLPGFEGLAVKVSSSGLGILAGNDAIDTAASIRRTDVGTWTGGTLTIDAEEDSCTASFSPDGSVTLAPGEETVGDWQTALKPF